MNLTVFFRKYLPLIVIPALIASLFTCCNPADKIDSSPSIRLSFSTDTVLFDTVFTTIGSSTRSFKVYNRNNHRINISDIRLSGAAGSPFRINIDGQAGNSFSNIDIDAHDSIFVFVRVNINPDDQNTPFVRQDSLLFTLNGNQQKMNLVAWGQNAHYILADTRSPGLPPYKIIAGKNQTVTWKADKPYVIYGYAVVDASAKLIIEAGARICFHNASGLWITQNGTLKVNGTIDQKVIFEGDRTELYYDDIAGQWDRIWINEGNEDNEINWAVIRNGFTGIQAETLDPLRTGKLIIHNTVIKNMSGYGLLAKQYNVEAGNLMIYDAGIQALNLSVGNYDFRQCTFANFWNKSARNEPSVKLSNYYTAFDAAGKDIQIKGNLSNAYFGNCQITGNKSNEIMLDNDSTAGTFNYQFDHSAIQTLSTGDAVHYPSYVKLPAQYSRIPIDSVIPAAINLGSMEIINSSPTPAILKNDLFGRNRTLNGNPDAGAIEFSTIKRKRILNP
jgi:hypothetical protein